MQTEVILWYASTNVLTLQAVVCGLFRLFGLIENWRKIAWRTDIEYFSHIIGRYHIIEYAYAILPFLFKAWICVQHWYLLKLCFLLLLLSTILNSWLHIRISSFLIKSVYSAVFRNRTEDETQKSSMYSSLLTHGAYISEKYTCLQKRKYSLEIRFN